MGRTSKPLRVLVTRAEMLAWPEVIEMTEKGHDVKLLGDDCGRDCGGFGAPGDVILGPECWRMTEKHRPFWALMIAAVRRWRYPKEAAGGDSEGEGQ